MGRHLISHLPLNSYFPQLPDIRMIVLLAFCLGLVVGVPTKSHSELHGPTVPLGDSTGHGQYKPVGQDHYAPNEVYKEGDMNDCHYVDKLVYKDECVPYVEQTCYTQQEEYCEDVYEKNCTAVIDEFEERECFEVTELQCHLSESIEYEVVQEQYTVLRCTRTSDRVCDTVYDLAVSTRDDFQCIDVEHQYCWDEEKIIKDRTCIFSVDFECGKSKPKDGKGSVDCDKVPTKKCYDTPRKIREEVCKPRVSKYCEKFTNEFPHPVEKQNCHSEPMKTCELETRMRPKKAKDYVYHKECKPVKRHCAMTARRRNCEPHAIRCRGTCAATSPRRSVWTRKSSTASSLRQCSMRRSASLRRK